MRQFALGAVVGGTTLLLLGFAIQRSPAARPTMSPPPTDSVAGQRYAIYDPSGTLPMLLDTHTGRTWYRQYGPRDSTGAASGLYWTPVKITAADTLSYWYVPGKAFATR